jgi:hypothetical protein
MNAMFVQWLIIGVLAVLATGYLARAAWRTLFAASGGCGGGCGCHAAAPKVKANDDLISPEQLTVRLNGPRRED